MSIPMSNCCCKRGQPKYSSSTHQVTPERNSQVFQLSFILRHHSDDKVAVFMHPHPRNPKETIYWEGPSMNTIDVKGHVILADTPIIDLIQEKWMIHAQKRNCEIRDLHFRIKMPLPELMFTRNGLALKVTSTKKVLWHCDSFNLALQPYDFLQAVVLLKKMLPLDPDTPDYCYSYTGATSANFRVFTIDNESKRIL